MLLNLSTDRPARARRRAADAGLVRAATRVPRRRAAARFRPRPRLRRPLREARARGVPRRAVSASGVLGGAGVGPRRRGPRGIDAIRGPSRPHRSIACGAQHRVCEHLCARASLCERAHTLLRAAASRATTARPRCHQPQVENHERHVVEDQRRREGCRAAGERRRRENQAAGRDPDPPEQGDWREEGAAAASERKRPPRKAPSPRRAPSAEPAARALR